MAQKQQQQQKPFHFDITENIAQDLDDSQTTQFYTSNYEIYQSKNKKLIANLSCDSLLISKEVVETLLDASANILYDHYISNKILGHAIKRTLYLSENMILNENILHDEPLKSPHCDLEPQKVSIDTWVRSQMNFEKKTLNHNNSEQQLQSEQNSPDLKNSKSSFNNTLRTNFSRKRANTHLNDKSHANNNNNKNDQAKEPQEVFKTVFLQTNNEEDHETEFLRIQKEREKRALIKKLEQDSIREQEQKDQQTKLRAGLLKDKRQITYDYDGKVIHTNQIKIDKLPTTVLALQHNVAKDQQISKKAIKPQYHSLAQIVKTVNVFENINFKKKNQNKLLSNNQSQSTNYAAQNIFDQIQLNHGVKITTGAQHKEGPVRMTSQETLNSLKSLYNQNPTDTQKLRITKTEYQNLVNQTDQLTQSKNNFKQKLFSNTDRNYSENQIKFVNNGQDQQQWVTLEPINSRKTTTKRFQRSKTESTLGTITINNKEELMKALAVDNTNDQLELINSIQQKNNSSYRNRAKSNFNNSIQQNTNKTNSNQNIPLNSIIDQMNQKILQNQHEIKKNSNLPPVNLQQIPKTNAEIKSLALANVARNPRNRINNIIIQSKEQKLLQELTDDAGTMTYLGQSKINYNNLNKNHDYKFEQLLDKLNHSQNGVQTNQK